MGSLPRTFAALVLLVAAGCATATSQWTVLPVHNRKGREVPVARVRIDLDKLAELVGGNPDEYAFYGLGREPLPFRLLPETAPRFVELRTTLPADGLRLTVVSPGPAATGSWPEGRVSRWPARVEYQRAHR